MKLQAFLEVQEQMENLDKSFVKMTDNTRKKLLGAIHKREFNFIVDSLVEALVELEGITEGDTKDTFTDLLQKAKKASSGARKLKKDKFATNEDIAKLGKGLFINLNVALKNLVELEVKDFVKTGFIKDIDLDVIKNVANSFKSLNPIAVLEEGMQTGARLLTFKEYVEAPDVHLYGADENVEACQIGKDNGVDKVAKGGINSMSKNCFDIVLYFQKHFTFEEIEESSNPEIVNFTKFFSIKNPVKSGGFVIFNLPYFFIPKFRRRLMSFKIEEIFRVDDEVGNLIFICTHKKPDEVSQPLDLRRAMFLPDRLPHYSEAKDFLLTKDLTLPETFRGEVIDGRDHLHMFRNEQDGQSLIEDIFEPVEQTLELNEPLQEYRVGHLASIAPTGITNGIYDTYLHQDMVDGEKMYPHILNTSLVRREVATMTEELKNGKVVPVISVKKTSELVLKTLTPDGKITSLLEKISEERKHEEIEKQKLNARKRKNPSTSK